MKESSDEELNFENVPGIENEIENMKKELITLEKNLNYEKTFIKNFYSS